MAIGTYRCSDCGEQEEHYFKAGQPPTGSVCGHCGKGILGWVPEPGGASFGDGLMEGTKESAHLQLCKPWERPPETKKELARLEKRNKVDVAKVAEGKRWV